MNKKLVVIYVVRVKGKISISAVANNISTARYYKKMYEILEGRECEIIKKTIDKK
ncbi:MAG: hypothetical protein ACI4PF_04785 [Christensenellales bacterium]